MDQLQPRRTAVKTTYYYNAHRSRYPVIVAASKSSQSPVLVIAIVWEFVVVRRQQWRSPGHSYNTNGGDNAATTMTWNGAVNTTGDVDLGHNNGDDSNHDDNSDENNKDYVTTGDDNSPTQ
ncbi:hypothetical protein EDB85DRAFT_1900716 [Lactarius pseudohatsudake]|nr:hypothetical protein EDB85DRAFT_1900716 [Lactarius pseudohatsudake]